MVESVVVFAEGPGFNFQHPYRNSQSSITQVPKGLTPSSSLCPGHQAGTGCTYIHAGI